MKIFLIIFFFSVGIQQTFADELVLFTGKSSAPCDAVDRLLLASAEINLQDKIDEWQINNPDVLLQNPRINKNVVKSTRYGVCWSKHAWVEATYVIESH